MVKKTYINLIGEPYVAELVDSTVYSKNGMHQGLLFRISDKKGETLGCLSAFIGVTTRAVWSHQVTLTPELVENLFLRIIPQIPFVAKIEEFSACYPECIQLF